MQIVQVDNYIWEIPRREKMRVPARIYADKILLDKMKTDRTLLQTSNVAHLPGIQKFSIALPDAHEGYGFPIGGVAGFTVDGGVISPGGIGYDINCGVRLLSTPLTAGEVRPKLKQLLDRIFTLVPSGVGRGGKVRLSHGELDEVMVEGVKWAIRQGYGFERDAERIEEGGSMPGANPENISHRAKQRGAGQLGSLGAGNHFLEIQVVDKIYNPAIAKAFGLPGEGGVTIMIHTGSRGFGHQVCSDYLRVMEMAARKYNIRVPDRELACAPWGSREAEKYFSAMVCAVNFAFTNRHMIMHWTRQAFKDILGVAEEELQLVYDVCHNVAKIEDHMVDGTRMKLVVHRKGATRAFPRGRPELPGVYRDVGQPVIIPGSMGTASYVLVGTEKSEELAFSSTAHGAGRMLSRARAVRSFRGTTVAEKLKARGILIRAASWRVVAEEAPEAYKDIDRVVDVSHKVGLAYKVARLVPIGVVKG